MQLPVCTQVEYTLAAVTLESTEQLSLSVPVKKTLDTLTMTKPRPQLRVWCSLPEGMECVTAIAPGPEASVAEGGGGGVFVTVLGGAGLGEAALGASGLGGAGGAGGAGGCSARCGGVGVGGQLSCSKQ